MGKIAVPEAILNKEGLLSTEEVKLVRQHPLTAFRILEPFVTDETALEAIRLHHERWDGDGYPEGLEGDRIPLMARLLALADALAAMTRPRAYRQALTWEDALRDTRGLAGKQFDPDLVDVLVDTAEDLKKLLLEPAFAELVGEAQSAESAPTT